MKKTRSRKSRDTVPLTLPLGEASDLTPRGPQPLYTPGEPKSFLQGELQSPSRGASAVQPFTPGEASALFSDEASGLFFRKPNPLLQGSVRPLLEVVRQPFTSRGAPAQPFNPGHQKEGDPPLFRQEKSYAFTLWGEQDLYSRGEQDLYWVCYRC